MIPLREIRWCRFSHRVQKPSAAQQHAYQLARQITRHYAKSFYLTTRFLPSEKQRAIQALYAFLRTTDNLVDAANSTATVSSLEHWKLRSRQPVSEQSDPVLLAWADTRDRFGIAQCVAEELIAGVASDLSTTRYGTLPELERYCYAVASTVGLMSAQIIGYADSYPNAPVTAQPYAIKLGLAMQLTNILRDIGEDARAGRIYLPQELLIRAGYSERELLAGQITPAWVTLMAELIAYTRQLYTESIPGIALLAAEGRFSVLAAARIYEAILGQIVANGYDVFTRRAQLSRNQKLRLLPQIWLECRRLRPPQP